jgi:NSS family neurotransmitter:Na+ symporter
MITGALCSLSLGAVPQLQLFGKSLFDFFDFISANILLTAGGFLTCIYVGWILPKQTFVDEVTNGGTLRSPLLHVLLLLVRFVCPAAIFAIFLHQFNLI